jgi:hypothetical protein
VNVCWNERENTTWVLHEFKPSRLKFFQGEFDMEDLFVVFWWSGPIGLGIFFMGVGILLWGISKIRNK